MDSIPVGVPVEELAAQANSIASASGVQVEKRRDDGSTYFECAPMSLLPNAYPKQAFAQAQTLAPHFNRLVDRVSRDADFLQQTLGGGVSDTDPYTAKLLKLYQEIYCGQDDNFAKTADYMGIHRSDYMLHKGADDKYHIKQVELNTIASSFASLSTKVAALHRHVTSRFEADVKELLQANKEKVVGTKGGDDDGVPINPALEQIPKAMAVAFSQYVSRFSPSNAVIVFVVQDGETNTVDQRMLEHRLWSDHQIPVVRMSLTRAHTEIERNDSTGALTITATGQEVAILYFRAGYAPTDYPDGYDGVEWQARAKLEQSRATKSPALGYHLAGTKKVQQELARPGVLERFFPDDTAAVEGLRAAFAGLYSLGEDATTEDKAAVKDVLLSGAEGGYVLKPQREGGGYNFYGEQLAAKLKENVKVTGDDVELAPVLGEFILMERLFPPMQRAILLRGGKVEGSGDTISELGCFAAVVASKDGNILHNEYAGFLLRTKFANVDEGGVASGFATLSSPYLC
ncbi:Glutathione synthetase, chloroplastic [Seminavis robusta]|uniref:Glutathione synthetase n=1 Tax=Seminavis robusta TaxID=568900 RepID=A0A9N8EGM5_9STRA|nr:Glutathione synthetase, chloroplastic [Seminavis robusta]|eukprot:Sro1170_g248710.1 Glutathione synthetase, chloroplastic (516) ;mRNA; r:12432-13979